MRKSSFSDIPGPSRLLRTAIKKKSNAGHNSKQIWRDLNMPAGSEDLLHPSVFTIPDRLLRHSTKMKSLYGPRARSKSRTVKSKYKTF